MFYKKLASQHYFLRIEKGEELVGSLLKFCEMQNIEAGQIQGIGGLTSATLGVYHLETSKVYEWRQFSGELELVNATGNVAFDSQDRVLHMHATIADESLVAYGGHLKNAIVGGTAEFYITDFGLRFERKFDADLGLKLLDFSDHA